jgi:hypothetical protein
MPDGGPSDDDLPAGGFSSWVLGLQGALRGDHDAEVPCDGCTACCRSSQFVPIGPDETDTLAHIPRRLLVPAPNLPAGHVVLGYDAHGRCPMLVDGRCSVYEHRPRACRTYDCRVLPAAGLGVDEGGTRVELARRTRRWRFGLSTGADRVRHAAVQTAATFLREHARDLPEGAVPAQATQLAALAVEVHDAFVGHDDAGEPTVVDHPDLGALRSTLSALRGGDPAQEGGLRGGQVADHELRRRRQDEPGDHRDRDHDHQAGLDADGVGDGPDQR